MGWNWRSTFRTGPMNWNFSRGGIGWSLNLGLFRYGVNPYGRRYIGFGIPGTGLYFWKYLDGSRAGGIIPPVLPQPTSSQQPVIPRSSGVKSANQQILDQIKSGHPNHP